jgi:hypothetical protein
MRRTVQGGIIGRPSPTLEINMLKAMAEYFTAEKQESLWFLAVALLALVVAVWLWINGHRLKSMAFPLVAVALIQLGVGGSVYLRTNNQLATLSAQAQSSPAAFKLEETKRMQVVMKNFSTYKIVEIALLLVGIGLVAFFQRSDLASGIGAGLLLQAAFMLAFDMFAEARGQDYLAALKAFSSSL